VTELDAIQSPPDPVASPTGYQEFILGLLGEDDPAVVQAATPAEVRSLVERAAGDLRTRPAEDEWAPIELVGHLVDAEVVTAARYRWILAQDRPDLIAYDQDLWADRLRHRDDDVEELLTLFQVLRRADLRLWERIPKDERERYGMHAERGPESFDMLFRLIAGHDRFHLDQLRSTLTAIGR
jgi:DinB superfamily